MECQNTIRTLKFNKDKRISTVVIIVEGEEDEFSLLKHIFSDVMNYDYRYIKRSGILHDEYRNKESGNTIIVANTRNSNIDSVLEDEEYKIKLSKILREEYNKNLKNVPVYVIWDRDKDKNKKDDIKYQEKYKKAIDTFYSAYENDYEMNGLLLLSYPCHESYILSNFKKRSFSDTYCESQECKKDWNKSIHSLDDINEKTILLAAENMHKGMLDFGINSYDPTNLKHENEIIYRKSEECFEDNKYFNSLSLISIMFVDLGIIEENK